MRSYGEASYRILRRVQDIIAELGPSKSNHTYWMLGSLKHREVFIMTTLSSLVAQKIVIMTAFNATSDYKFVTVTAFYFRFTVTYPNE